MLEQLIELITQYGFPALCLLGMGWYVVQKDKATASQEQRLIEQIDKSNEGLMRAQEKTGEQLSSFADSLHKFNETLIRIDTRLENVEKKID